MLSLLLPSSRSLLLGVLVVVGVVRLASRTAAIVMDPAVELPTEVFLGILTYLPVEDVCRARLVCKAWVRRRAPNLPLSRLRPPVVLFFAH